MDIGSPNHPEGLLAIHEAFAELEHHNSRLAHPVELRYIGGLQLDEIAATLDVSLATVKRGLALGEGWLHRADLAPHPG